MAASSTAELEAQLFREFHIHPSGAGTRQAGVAVLGTQLRSSHPNELTPGQSGAHELEGGFSDSDSRDAMPAARQVPSHSSMAQQQHPPPRHHRRPASAPSARRSSNRAPRAAQRGSTHRRRRGPRPTAGRSRSRASLRKRPGSGGNNRKKNGKRTLVRPQSATARTFRVASLWSPVHKRAPRATVGNARRFALADDAHTQSAQAFPLRLLREFCGAGATASGGAGKGAKHRGKGKGAKGKGKGQGQGQGVFDEEPRLSASLLGELSPAVVMVGTVNGRVLSGIGNQVESQRPTSARPCIGGALRRCGVAPVTASGPSVGPGTYNNAEHDGATGVVPQVRSQHRTMPRVAFGSAKRLVNADALRSPGPVYSTNRAQRLVRRNPPRYSFPNSKRGAGGGGGGGGGGSRRITTPGPNRYDTRSASARTTMQRSAPAFSFGSARRF